MTRGGRMTASGLVAGAALLLAAAPVAGQSFFQGKRINVFVGFAAGGTADTDGRIVAQFLGRHIPGNPNLVVQNEPAAAT